MDEKIKETAVKTAEKTTEEPAEKTVREEKPADGAPVFDIQKVINGSPEEIDSYARDYTDAVARYVKNSLACDMEGVIDDLEKREEEAAFASAGAALSANGDLYDFAEHSGQVRELVSAIPGMNTIPPESAMTLCYLMIKGAQALGEHKNPKEESAEELADKIYARGDVMKLLMSRRARECADEELPVMVKGGGAAVSVRSKPKTFADARSSAEKHLKY